MAGRFQFSQMTCEVLGLEHTTISLDLWKGEHMTPDYLKMNPQHTVPTVKEGDLCLTESRAAATYLVDKAIKCQPLAKG